ncbi:MAG: hypothetical protein ACRD2Z_00535, partial [Thermoanaerobaculia bacterium]
KERPDGRSQELDDPVSQAGLAEDDRELGGLGDLLQDLELAQARLSARTLPEALAGEPQCTGS